MLRQITSCPICDSALRVTELTCSECETRLHGDFPPGPLGTLASEHQAFIETFVRCRGVIREVERALGISYPTVRSRLDATVEALEIAVAAAAGAKSKEITVPHSVSERRRSILHQVEDGLLEPEEAAELLRAL